MKQMTSMALKRALWQIPAIGTLAAMIAVSVNLWRPDGIPLVGDWSAEVRFSDAEGESLVIDFDPAKALFEQDGAIFVDARAENQYVQGHIRGALNLPWQGVERYLVEVAERLEAASKPIITYCDGENCELSHELALYLKEMGFNDVRVLVNGWSVWQGAGLPTEGEGTAS